MQFQTAGTAYVVGDTQVTPVGTPTVVYSMHAISGGGGGAVIIMKNGDGSGSLYIREVGTINLGVNFEYGTFGMIFPDGLYVDPDANLTSLVISYGV